MSIKMEVWGDYALFTRPEMKTERTSYDVMTPSAARGIVEAVYYHPGLKWHIDRIHVLNPIRFTTQMSSPRQKEICLGLDYFLVYLPSCSNSDTKIMCSNRLLQQK